MKKAEIATVPNWHDAWLKLKPLEELLSRVNPREGLARLIWSSLINRYSAANFDQHADDSPRFLNICDQYPEHISGKDRERLEGWRILNQQFMNPENKPETCARLKTACDDVHCQAEELIWELPTSTTWSVPPERQGTQDSMSEARKGGSRLFEHESSFENENQAFAQALTAVSGLPDGALKMTCKTELFYSIVTKPNRRDIAVANRDNIRDTAIYAKNVPKERPRKPQKAGSSSSRYIIPATVVTMLGIAIIALSYTKYSMNPKHFLIE